MSKDFTVVFEKLDELQKNSSPAEQRHVEPLVISPDNLREMDEISELRRLVAEITEPEPTSYTMT